MSNTLAIARRELSGFFYSPIAYVVICLWAVTSLCKCAPPLPFSPTGDTLPDVTEEQP